MAHIVHIWMQSHKTVNPYQPSSIPLYIYILLGYCNLHVISISSFFLVEYLSCSRWSHEYTKHADFAITQIQHLCSLYGTKTFCTVILTFYGNQKICTIWLESCNNFKSIWIIRVTWVGWGTTFEEDVSNWGFLVTSFEIHTPLAKDLLFVCNRGSVVYKWISLLGNAIWNSHPLCSVLHVC